MRVRRALAIVLATPVLLATIGMNGASAAPPQRDTTGGSTTRLEPIPGSGHRDASDRKHGRVKMSPDDEMDGGVLGNIAGELLGRV